MNFYAFCEVQGLEHTGQFLMELNALTGHPQRTNIVQRTQLNMRVANVEASQTVA